MIIWKSREKLETRSDSYPCRTFRRVFEVTLGKDGFSAGFVDQYQLKSDGEWRTSHAGNFEVTINKNWIWGEEHFYYDGPHCFRSFGFVHFAIPAKDGWCDKCFPPRDNDACWEGDDEE